MYNKNDISALKSVSDLLDGVLGVLDDVDGSIGNAQQDIENILTSQEADNKDMVNHYSKYDMPETGSKATVIKSDGSLVTLMV